MSVILFIFVAIINLTIHEFANVNLVKSNSICDEKFVLATHFDSTQCDAANQEYFVESKETCVPGCVQMLDLNAKCGPEIEKICAPGLKCGIKVCVKDDECTEEAKCANGFCVTKVCDADEDCSGPGQVKCTAGLCGTNDCVTDDDCTKEEKCANGICVTKVCGVEVDHDCTKQEICADGLCAIKVCIIDDASCAKYNYFPNYNWMPDCLPDGTFAQKQCKGEKQNGRCYCYDPFGKRIFGEMWSNRAENMTCACSRHRNALERAGRNDVTLHCDSTGNYEPLQCDSGSCWCADPKSGEVLDTVVPESMMKLLPCYDSKKIGSQYLRQCESQLFAQAKIKNEFLAHGTDFVNLPFLECGYDGSFGRFKLEKENMYCTWRDNSMLGFSTSKLDADAVDCNCARDHKIYEMDGKTLTKICSGDGGYKILQNFEGTSSYCVDQDGFISSKESSSSLTQDDCPPWNTLP